MGKHFAYIAVATAVLALILSAICPPRSTPPSAGPRKHAQYGQLPLTFEPNQGQNGSMRQIYFAQEGRYDLC